MLNQIRKFSREPLFKLGVFLRIFLVLLVLPRTQYEWFVPFLHGTLTHISIDPWTTHLQHNGDILAFPYGPVMLLVYLPAVALGTLCDLLLKIDFFSFVGFGLTTAVLDLCLLLLLDNLLKAEIKKLLIFYWFSPIVLYVCYWHGQNDVLPVTLFVAGLLALKRRQPALAGIMLGFAAAAKLSMLLAAPLIFIYLLRNGGANKTLLRFSAGLICILLVGQMLFLFSPGFTQMVLGSREFKKVYSVALELGTGQKIYILPLIYGLLLFAMWKIERISFDLLYALIGIVFFLILALTPASSGWFLWAIPFLVGFQIRSGTVAACLGLTFSLLFVVTNLAFSWGARVRLLPIDLQTPLLAYSDSFDLSHVHSLLITGTCLLAVVQGIQMFIYGVRHNDYYRISRRPIGLGIAGDSGSGKDTLSNALSDVFGAEYVTNISGDNYHKWDRQAPMWKVLSHLDPRANDLQQFARDVRSILDGRSILSRHYNHQQGIFNRGMKLQKNNVIVVSGLHALYLPQIRNYMDVRIYLDMDEQLRTAFKMRRDVDTRNKRPEEVHASIEERRHDAERYVKPQMEVADIIFSLLPADSQSVYQCIDLSRFKLQIRLRNGVYYEDLLRRLIGIGGLQVDYSLRGGNNTVEMIVEGDPSADDIEFAANELMQELAEIVAPYPHWKGGMLGVMQIITLYQIHERLLERLSNVANA